MKEQSIITFNNDETCFLFIETRICAYTCFVKILTNPIKIFSLQELASLHSFLPISYTIHIRKFYGAFSFMLSTYTLFRIRWDVCELSWSPPHTSLLRKGTTWAFVCLFGKLQSYRIFLVLVSSIFRYTSSLIFRYILLHLLSWLCYAAFLLSFCRREQSYAYR